MQAELVATQDIEKHGNNHLLSKELLQKMMAKGIMVRGYELQGKPWCRVSMGTMDEIKQFVSALEAIS